MEKINENITFEELLNQTLKEIKVGQTVTGTVIEITPKNEVFIDIGYKADGIIPANEYILNAGETVQEKFKLGDRVTAVIVKLNDGLGNVLLSYNRARREIDQKEFESKVNNNTVFKSIVSEVNEKGLITNFNTIKIFIPLSLSGINKQPNSPYAEEALTRMADIQERYKEYPEAFVSYQKLERLAQRKESRQNARLGMLRMAVELGDNKAVIDVSKKLLDDPTLSPEHIRTARAARAESFLSLNKPAQAAAEWEKLAEDPRTEIGAKSAYLLAQYHFDKGNDTQAEAVVNRLLENGTSHQYWLARSFIVLADIHTRRGDSFKARQYLLSLQNNYTADDDIKELVAVRLEKLESTANTDAQ